MRQSLTYLYIHLVWSTWKRKAIILPELESILYQLMEKKIAEKNCYLINIGGTSDHIHLLVNLNPKVSISELVKEVKGYSSYMVANHISPNQFFKWQGGYSAFSVSPKRLERVSAYISNQKNHHRDRTCFNRWEPKSRKTNL